MVKERANSESKGYSFENLSDNELLRAKNIIIGNRILKLLNEVQIQAHINVLLEDTSNRRTQHQSEQESHLVSCANNNSIITNIALISLLNSYQELGESMTSFFNELKVYQPVYQTNNKIDFFISEKSRSKLIELLTKYRTVSASIKAIHTKISNTKAIKDSKKS